MSNSHRVWQRVFSVLIMVGLFFSLAQPAGARTSFLSEQKGKPSPGQPVVKYSIRNDVTPPLRDMQPRQVKPGKTQGLREIPLRPLPNRNNQGTKGSTGPDPALQGEPGRINMPAPSINFEGLGNSDNGNVLGFLIAPPDTSGAVGYDSGSGKKYYVQWVNLVFAIWDVTSSPTMIYGPVAGNTLWQDFGGICETNNDGDIIVLFDELSNRWFMSQFALFGAPDGFHQCMAISASADPTGAWYRYDFLASPTKLNDYPKFGIWPDGIYMTANQFTNGFSWGGTGVWVFERDQMLLGQPARMVYFDLYESDPDVGGMLPADLDGVLPPAGTPNYFVNFDDDAFGYPVDQLRVWAFHVDWTTPANSTFTLATILPTASFDSQVCNAFRGVCIDQPNGQKLEDLADRLMFRLQYRNFGDHQAMVVNHTVNADGDGKAGVRWYELRDSGGGWGIYQQGTYSPDGEARWMGSIAMDRAGNIALGYSVSSLSTYPSIRYAGRLAGDPLGILSQAEVELASGNASQEGIARWGDYSEMTVDPTDDCTFWYTQEYVFDTNPWNWGNWFTRIGSFKYPTCTSGPSGNLEGTIRQNFSSTPISDALIDLGSGIMTFSDENGHYQILNLPVGAYDVTAWKYGYLQQTVSGVGIEDGGTAIHDIFLDPAPIVTVNGVISDLTPGWPLYARIDISTYGHSETVFSNPLDGQYSLDLYQDTAYLFRVEAVSPGYIVQERSVTPPAGGATENFALAIDPVACSAPGYAPEYVYFQNFDSTSGGFTVSGDNPSWEWGSPTSGPNKAHSGDKVWATNLAGNYNDNENSQITSLEIDLSAYLDRTIIVSWWQWLKTEQDFDYASVDLSNDGGVTWMTFFGPVSGTVNDHWTQYTLYLDSTFAVSNFLIRFHLYSDSGVNLPGFYVDDVGVAVSAPPDYLYKQDFESGDGSYTISGDESSWEWGVPTRGPGNAHSGTQAWATNLSGDYNNDENSFITSPEVDLSALANQVKGGGGGGGGIVLNWWQWLQTEAGYDYGSVEISANGGITWTLIYTSSGIADTRWNQYGMWLDPSYLVNNFRVRFHLQSDGDVAYPGYYVDDVTISIPPVGPPQPPCAALPGGLVIGNVYDGNTDVPLNGAVVSDGAGNLVTTFATPVDSNVADGFYILFAQAGIQTLTASKSGGYGADVATPTVIANSVIQQDFDLPAGWLSSNPTAVEATLEMGMTTTLPLTLTNAGGLPAIFKLTERDGGTLPAVGKGAPVRRRPGFFTPHWIGRNILSGGGINKPIPIDAPPWMDIANYPSAIMDNVAAEYNGLIYSVGGFDGFGNLNSGSVYDPASDAWSPIANMNGIREKPAGAFIDGFLYIIGGWDNTGNPDANLEIYDPVSNTWTSGASVPTAYAAATAVALDRQLYVIGGCDSMTCGSTDVFRYDSASNSWATVAPYPEPVSWNACGAIGGMVYCAGGVAEAGGEIIRTYVYDPAADTWTQLADMPQTQWGMGFTAANGKLYISGGVTANMSVITNETFVFDPTTNTWGPDANSNNILYRGASACGFYKIGGSTGGFSPVPNSELYPGLADCGAASDAPWLSENPITDTLTAGEHQVIELTLDSSVPEVNQPGRYLADLNVKTNTPYKLDPIPVVMIVNPPTTWGKVTGLVTGLARCDAAGAPLSEATVEISGTTFLQTGSNGVYGYWLEQGNYTLNVSVNGYLSKISTVTVYAGATSIVNFDLRLDAPCASSAPDSIDVTLLQGNSTVITLTLNDFGAADLTFNTLETQYNLLPTTRLDTGTDGIFSLHSTSGPTSVRSWDRLANFVGGIPLSPDSGWYGGLSMPNGIVRYAHAQCDEQPDSFYVISGVDNNFAPSAKTWRYDSGSNTWTELAPFPASQEGPTAVCYLGKIYVLGGGGTNQFYVYDIATNTWAAGAAVPRGVAGAAAGAWNGKVFLIGGDDDFTPASGVSAQVNVYDITSNTWITDATSMPVGTSFPGFVQAGPYVYVVGGWGDLAPTQNVTATLRYDISNDTWEFGPEFTSARADFALALTDSALYAIAGDQNGNGFFDVTDLVERLDLSNWSSGAWSNTGDPLPIKVSANNAGFCASMFSTGAIWNVGGGDPNTGTIYGSNLFKPVAGEICFSIYGDVPWLAEDPIVGVIAHDSRGNIVVSIDASNLPAGVYHATLVFLTNDKDKPIIVVPVTLTVNPLYRVFLPIVSVP